MTNFGSFLGQIIASDFEGRQVAFANASGVKPPSITNYLKTEELPSHENLRKLLASVKDEFKRKELFAAYVADLCERIGMRLDEEASAHGASKRDDEIAATLNTLRGRARKEPKFLRILKDVADWPA